MYAFPYKKRDERQQPEQWLYELEINESPTGFSYSFHKITLNLNGVRDDAFVGVQRADHDTRNQPM